jgi:hypothetical protein
MISLANSHRRSQRWRVARALVLLSLLSLWVGARANAAENVAIFVDGVSVSSTGIPVLADVAGLASFGIPLHKAFIGPQPIRSQNYLLNESALPSLIRAKVPTQLQVVWNGDLRDAQATRDAVTKVETMICQQRGRDVDIISHSLGTVIAYTALAELAGISGARATPACVNSRIVSFVTLASPLGLDDSLPESLGNLSGINIPPLANVQSARALRIQGRWLNVYASGDKIGGKIDIPSVVNVSFSLDQSSINPIVAHSFPYKDADSVRLIADVILGVHARIPPFAGATPPGSVQPGAMPDQPVAMPKLPFIERDKEIDYFASKWRLLKPFPLYAKEGGGTVIDTLPKGLNVDGLSLAMHTLSYAVAELKSPLARQFSGDNFNQATQQREIFTIPLQRGDKIVYISYFGEGECRVWVKGRTYISGCFDGGDDDELARNANYSGSIKTTHWASVKTPDGSEGWLWIKDADFESIQGISKHGESVGE